MTDNRPHPDSGGFSAWFLPSLCVMMAIALVYLAIQNMSLKRQLSAHAEQMAAAAPVFADKTGELAPPFKAYLPDGQEFAVRTDSLQAPLVFAWLSFSCDPCIEALDNWNLLAVDYPGQVWGICREPWSSADSIFQEAYIGFPIIQPLSDSVFEQYRIQATPQTTIILEDGLIGGVWYGPLSEEAKARISDLMQQPFIERR